MAQGRSTKIILMIKWIRTSSLSKELSSWWPSWVRSLINALFSLTRNARWAVIRVDSGFEIQTSPMFISLEVHLSSCKVKRQRKTWLQRTLHPETSP